MVNASCLLTLYSLTRIFCYCSSYGNRFMLYNIVYTVATTLYCRSNHSNSFHVCVMTAFLTLGELVFVLIWRKQSQLVPRTLTQRIKKRSTATGRINIEFSCFLWGPHPLRSRVLLLPQRSSSSILPVKLAPPADLIDAACLEDLDRPLLLSIAADWFRRSTQVQRQQ